MESSRETRFNLSRNIPDIIGYTIGYIHNNILRRIGMKTTILILLSLLSISSRALADNPPSFDQRYCDQSGANIYALDFQTNPGKVSGYQSNLSGSLPTRVFWPTNYTEDKNGGLHIVGESNIQGTYSPTDNAFNMTSTFPSPWTGEFGTDKPCPPLPTTVAK